MFSPTNLDHASFSDCSLGNPFYPTPNFLRIFLPEIHDEINARCSLILILHTAVMNVNMAHKHASKIK